MFQTFLSFVIGLASGVLLTLLILHLRERQRIKKLQHSKVSGFAPEMEELTTWAPDVAWDTVAGPEFIRAETAAIALQADTESQEQQTTIALDTASTINPEALQDALAGQSHDSSHGIEPEVAPIEFEMETPSELSSAELNTESEPEKIAAADSWSEAYTPESTTEAAFEAEAASDQQLPQLEAAPIAPVAQEDEAADSSTDLADELAKELAAQVEAELAAQAAAELAAKAEAELAAQAAAELAAKAAAELAAQAAAELAAQAAAELAAQAEAELAAQAEAELAAQAEAELAAQAAAELAAKAKAELAAQAEAELAAQAEAELAAQAEAELAAQAEAELAAQAEAELAAQAEAELAAQAAVEEQAKQAALALELAGLEAARIAQEEQERANQQALALEQQQAQLAAEQLEAAQLEAEWQALQAEQQIQLALERGQQEQALTLQQEQQQEPVSAPPAAVKVIKDPADTIILVADDSKVVRVKTSRVLAKHTYQVNLAEDGIDAANQIAFALPDVLVTDVEMPGMDGFALTLHLRNNPATAHLPIIMISGASDELADKAKQAGVNVLLGKPYADEELIGHIQRLVQDAPV